MRKPRYHPPTCKVCGRGAADGVYVSARGLCEEDALLRWAENDMQLKAKRGPYAQWWAAKLAVSLGYFPLDELPPKP